MGSEDSSPCSQELSTGPYPEPAESSPYPGTNFFKIFLILSSNHAWVFQSALPIKILCLFFISLIPPPALHIPPVSFSLISFP
jgi:hypothetical protein